MHTHITFEVIGFALGLLFGSFLNVCISRLPQHRSIATPRSHCPICGHTVRWYDNIPVLSFLFLRARCRDCGAPISWRYPFVELAAAAWCARVAYDFSQLWIIYTQSDPAWAAAHSLEILHTATTLLFLPPLGLLLIALAVTDWETHILPDTLTWPGIGIGFFLTCVEAIFLAPGQGDIHLNQSMRMSSPGSMAVQGNVFLTGPEHLIFGKIAAAVVAAGVLLLIRALYKLLRRREGLGLGDVKLLAMIAMFLGFWPSMLALFFGVVLCSLYALPLLLTGRASAASRLPLGTFLCLGGLISALTSDVLLPWYKALL